MKRPIIMIFVCLAAILYVPNFVFGYTSGNQTLSLPELNGALRFAFSIYEGVRNLIQELLVKTLFKANPELSQVYGDSIILLSSLSACYILLMTVNICRKALGYLLVGGWIVLLFSIALRVFG